MILSYVVDCESDGKPVKYILKNKLELSERLIKKLKYDSKILKNSIPVYINEAVSVADVIEAIIDFEEENEDIIPENLPIDIIYEDDGMIAVNKQAGIVVHPTSKHFTGTIANGIMYYFKQNDINKTIRPVSRLDRDTSGIIIFAKNQYIQENLIRQMTAKTFRKEYVGIVTGSLEQDKGTINLPIERQPGSIMLRHISQTGSPSVTHFEVIERFTAATYVRFELETGRTHQIRVHCQAIEHPLLGETLYSDLQTDLIERQALHSIKVSFNHPQTNEKICLTAPLPKDIENVLEILRK